MGEGGRERDLTERLYRDIHEPELVLHFQPPKHYMSSMCQVLCYSNLVLTNIYPTALNFSILCLLDDLSPKIHRRG